MCLFNGVLFSLLFGENGVNLDDGDVWVKSVEVIFDYFKGEYFEVFGLSIDLLYIELLVLQVLVDCVVLCDQKECLEKELKQFKIQQSVVVDCVVSKVQVEKLYQDVLDVQKVLEDFCCIQMLIVEEFEKFVELVQLEVFQDEFKCFSDVFVECVQQFFVCL